jgi:hypothetical protein
VNPALIAAPAPVPSNPNPQKKTLQNRSALDAPPMMLPGPFNAPRHAPLARSVPYKVLNRLLGNHVVRFAAPTPHDLAAPAAPRTSNYGRYNMAHVNFSPWKHPSSFLIIAIIRKDFLG